MAMDEPGLERADEPRRLALLRGEIAPKVAQFYPQFAARVWAIAA